jgi:pimeloyl-ACP methyl ester carboxylesterase
MPPLSAGRSRSHALSAGGKDELVQPANPAFARKKLSHVAFREISLEDCGHFIPQQRPEKVAAALSRLLRMRTEGP